MINSLFTNPLNFIISIMALLVAIDVHEYAHARAAEELGDPTARLQGRLSLNPFVHIDLTGMLFLLFFGFGWGKPVPFDPFNLKNPKKDAALISIAGPSANLILALILSLMLRLFILFKLNFLYTIGSYFFTPLVVLNVVLAIFNLLPISPLDGFKIVGGILSDEKSRQWYELERYGILFLLLLIFPLAGSSMLNLIISPTVSFITNLLLPKLPGAGII